MGKRFILITLVSLMIISFIMPSCNTQTSTTTANQEQQIAVKGSRELSFACFRPNQGGDSEAIQWWADEVAKRTNGAITIKVYWGGSLAQLPEIPAAVRTGTADIGDAMWATVTETGLYSMFDEPFGFWDKPVAAWLAAEQMQDETPEFQAMLTKNNMKRLTYFGVGSFSIVSTKKPIRKLDDLKGLKVRSTGPMQVLCSAAGASPISAPGKDDYDNLMKNIYDATCENINQVYWYKLYEVADYITKVGMWANPSAGAMINLNVWNSLTPEIQKVFNDLRKEYLFKSAEIQKAEADNPGWKGLEEKGMEVIELPTADLEAWKNKPEIINLANDWMKKRTVQLGIPASRLEEILNQFIKLRGEYAEKYPDSW